MHIFYQQRDFALQEIRGIKFTLREVDVISCIVHGRGSKKTGDLLEISPKTAEAHVRNIMIKIDCNSRESIIDFVEGSQEIQNINEHYFRLVRYKTFIQSLIEISNTYSSDFRVALGYDKSQSEQKLLFTELKKCFEKSGIGCDVSRLSYSKDTESEGEKEIKLFLYRPGEEGNQSTYAIAFSAEESLPEDISERKVFNFRNELSAYKSFYKILQVIIPSLDINKFIKALDIKQAHTVNFPGGGKHAPQNTPSNKVRKPIYAVVGVGLALLFTVLGLLQWGSLSGEKFKTVRADLIIPKQEFLLNRDKFLNSIKAKFKEDQSKVKIVTLVGIGGSGKSTLARQFAYSDNADLVWEIEAQSVGSIASSFESLAYSLAQSDKKKQELEVIEELKDPTGRDKQLLHFVKTTLREHPGWLLIYDNLEEFSDVKNYFPFDHDTWGNGRVIITTRNENLKNNNYIKNSNVLSIGALDDQEKLNLFTKILSETPADYLKEMDKEFLRHIPSFPLDVSVCAYYLKNSGLSPQHYLDNINNMSQQFTDLQLRLSSDVSGYKKTRYGILTLSLDKLLQNNPEFTELLLLITFINNYSIPVELLSKLKDEATAENFIYHLKYYSLVVPNPVFQDGFSIHECTQHLAYPYLVTKLKLDKNQQPVTRVASTFNEFLKEEVDRIDYGRMRGVIPHVKKILGYSELYPLVYQGEITGQLGRIYYYLGDYDTAVTYLQESADIFVSIYGENHRRLAWIYTYLGKVYRNQGKYFLARKYLERSFKLYEKTKDSLPSKYAWSSAHLGNIYRSLGDFDKGEYYLRKSLKIYKEILGNDNIKVAWVSTHLANILRGVNKRDESLELMLASYPVFLEKYGEKHPLTSWAHACLGRILIDLGRLDEAQAILEKNLENYRKNFGDGHIQTSWILRGLGRLYLAKSEKEKATGYFEESLKILRDKGHPDVYIALELLADTLLLGSSPNDGDRDTALKYLEEAKTIVDKHFPENSFHRPRIIEKIQKLNSTSA